MNSVTIHAPVMLGEVMDAVAPQPGGRYLDATLGGGSYTAELLARSAPKGQVISLDLDEEALLRARDRFASAGKRWKGMKANFRDLADIAEREKMVPLDGIVMDLGLSSDELSDPERGLSFKIDGPLDMRLDLTDDESLTAYQIVNSWKESEIARIIREYGEERFANRIAQAIVAARKSRRISRTVELADLIRSVLPKFYERGRIDPATRTFQALRIAVNDELGALTQAIKGAERVLRPGGVLVIVSFHSLEDRVVKHAFRESSKLEVLFKKPQIASDEELERNPRARSAKLRAARQREE